MKTLYLLSAVALIGNVFAETPKPPDAARVHIRNVAEKTVLRPRNAERADGIPIVLYPIVDWKCVTWKMTASKDGTCVLTNHFTGKGIAPDDKGFVVQVPPNKSAEWKFSPIGQDRWRILATDGKRCMAVDQGRIVLREPKDNDESQLWSFYQAP